MALPEIPKKPKMFGFQMAQVFAVAFEMGFIIALPIVVLAYLGKWLDRTHGTRYFVYIGIILALFSSTAWLYKRLNGLVETLTKAAKHKDK